MAERLLLVRHASTGQDFTGRFIGSSDVTADKEALQSLSGLARLIASFSPAHCVCSPMIRAKQTAEIIASTIGVQMEEDKNLREIDFGHWEKLSFQEITKKDPELVEQWGKMPPDFQFPAGERMSNFQKRVQESADRLAQLPGNSVLAVTHGGVIRTMICHLLGLSLRDYLLFDIRTSSLTVIDLFDGRGVLAGLNLNGLVKSQNVSNGTL